VLGLDVYFVSNANSGRRETVSVRGELITILCGLNLILKHCMQFVEVDSIAASLYRGDIAFRMYGEVRIVAFVRKEGRDAGGGTGSVIIGKFREGKEFGPVVLLVIAIDPNILL